MSGNVTTAVPPSLSEVPFRGKLNYDQFQCKLTEGDLSLRQNADGSLQVGGELAYLNKKLQVVVGEKPATRWQRLVHRVLQGIGKRPKHLSFEDYRYKSLCTQSCKLKDRLSSTFAIHTSGGASLKAVHLVRKGCTEYVLPTSIINQCHKDNLKLSVSMGGQFFKIFGSPLAMRKYFVQLAKEAMASLPLPPDSDVRLNKQFIHNFEAGLNRFFKEECSWDEAISGIRRKNEKVVEQVLLRDSGIERNKTIKKSRSFETIQADHWHQISEDFLSVINHESKQVCCATKRKGKLSSVFTVVSFGSGNHLKFKAGKAEEVVVYGKDVAAPKPYINLKGNVISEQAFIYDPKKGMIKNPKFNEDQTQLAMQIVAIKGATYQQKGASRLSLNGLFYQPDSDAAFQFSVTRGNGKPIHIFNSEKEMDAFIESVHESRADNEPRETRRRLNLTADKIAMMTPEELNAETVPAFEYYLSMASFPAERRPVAGPLTEQENKEWSQWRRRMSTPSDAHVFAQAKAEFVKDWKAQNCRHWKDEGVLSNDLEWALNPDKYSSLEETKNSLMRGLAYIDIKRPAGVDSSWVMLSPSDSIVMASPLEEEVDIISTPVSSSRGSSLHRGIIRYKNHVSCMLNEPFDSEQHEVFRHNGETKVKVFSSQLEAEQYIAQEQFGIKEQIAQCSHMVDIFNDLPEDFKKTKPQFTEELTKALHRLKCNLSAAGKDVAWVENNGFKIVFSHTISSADVEVKEKEIEYGELKPDEIKEDFLSENCSMSDKSISDEITLSESDYNDILSWPDLKLTKFPAYVPEGKSKNQANDSSGKWYRSELRTKRSEEFDEDVDARRSEAVAVLSASNSQLESDGQEMKLISAPEEIVYFKHSNEDISISQSTSTSTEIETDFPLTELSEDISGKRDENNINDLLDDGYRSQFRTERGAELGKDVDTRRSEAVATLNAPDSPAMREEVQVSGIDSQYSSDLTWMPISFDQPKTPEDKKLYEERLRYLKESLFPRIGVVDMRKYPFVYRLMHELKQGDEITIGANALERVLACIKLHEPVFTAEDDKALQVPFKAALSVMGVASEKVAAPDKYAGDVYFELFIRGRQGLVKNKKMLRSLMKQIPGYENYEKTARLLVKVEKRRAEANLPAAELSAITKQNVERYLVQQYAAGIASKQELFNLNYTLQDIMQWLNVGLNSPAEAQFQTLSKKAISGEMRETVFAELCGSISGGKRMYNQFKMVNILERGVLVNLPDGMSWDNQGLPENIVSEKALKTCMQRYFGKPLPKSNTEAFNRFYKRAYTRKKYPKSMCIRALCELGGELKVNKLKRLSSAYGDKLIVGLVAQGEFDQPAALNKVLVQACADERIAITELLKFDLTIPEIMGYLPASAINKMVSQGQFSTEMLAEAGLTRAHLGESSRRTELLQKHTDADTFKHWEAGRELSDAFVKAQLLRLCVLGELSPVQLNVAGISYDQILPPLNPDERVALCLKGAIPASAVSDELTTVDWEWQLGLENSASDKEKLSRLQRLLVQEQGLPATEKTLIPQVLPLIIDNLSALIMKQQGFDDDSLNNEDLMRVATLLYAAEVIPAEVMQQLGFYESDLAAIQESTALPISLSSLPESVQTELNFTALGKPEILKHISDDQISTIEDGNPLSAFAFSIGAPTVTEGTDEQELKEVSAQHIEVMKEKGFEVEHLDGEAFKKHAAQLYMAGVLTESDISALGFSDAEKVQFSSMYKVPVNLKKLDPGIRGNVIAWFGKHAGQEGVAKVAANFKGISKHLFSKADRKKVRNIGREVDAEQSSKTLTSSETATQKDKNTLRKSALEYGAPAGSSEKNSEIGDLLASIEAGKKLRKVPEKDKRHRDEIGTASAPSPAGEVDEINRGITLNRKAHEITDSESEGNQSDSAEWGSNNEAKTGAVKNKEPVRKPASARKRASTPAVPLSGELKTTFVTQVIPAESVQEAVEDSRLSQLKKEIRALDSFSFMVEGKLIKTYYENRFEHLNFEALMEKMAEEIHSGALKTILNAAEPLMVRMAGTEYPLEMTDKVLGPLKPFLK